MKYFITIIVCCLISGFMYGKPSKKAADDQQETIDVGYGTVKKKNNTTPRNGISGEELQRTGETNLLRALEGRVPGLVISTSGNPSDEPSVMMRGMTSINLSNEPLYIVDDVEVGSLDFVNIYDVDYVEIMKDASIYGSRGANGAIIVHTKTGAK